MASAHEADLFPNSALDALFPNSALDALRYRVERSAPGEPCSFRASIDEPSFRLILPTMSARGDWARGLSPETLDREAGALEVLLVVRLASQAIVEAYEDDRTLDGCAFEGAAYALDGTNARLRRWIVRFRFDRSAWSEIETGRGTKKVRDAMRDLVLSDWAHLQLSSRLARLPAPIE
jgi:hypothetical protein